MQLLWTGFYRLRGNEMHRRCDYFKASTGIDAAVGCETRGRSHVTEESDARLTALRRELDEVDVRLREAVRERIAVCSRVAHVKREFDIPMMQPGRVGVVQDRAREFARAHGLSEEFLSGVYDLLIAEACRVEDLIIESDSSVGDRA
jgi:chorismate mutase-like protein